MGVSVICLPSESTLIKTSPNILINGSSNCDPLILTRETLRNLIQNEIQGKKRTQERIDLISEQLEYIDGEDSSYKTFINEDWEFYQRIINRLNRRYEEFCNQSKKHKDWRLLHFQKIIGRFIRIHCSQSSSDGLLEAESKLTNKLKKRLKLTPTSPVDLAAQNKILDPLIYLNTLAIEVRGLVKILESLKVSKNILELLSQEEYLGKTKIDNELVSNEFLRIKGNNPKLTYDEIAKTIYDRYPGQFKTSSRIRKIIFEERDRSIRLRLKYLSPNLGNDRVEDNLVSIAKYYFTDIKGNTPKNKGIKK